MVTGVLSGCLCMERKAPQCLREGEKKSRDSGKHHDVPKQPSERVNQVSERRAMGTNKTSELQQNMQKQVERQAMVIAAQSESTIVKTNERHK